ncbi:MAG: hypothetical protein LBQ61_00650 [Spirochaetales bacterium]|jgi:hypothetical protein|nr:hypothetical protein [Spirochaetales bacterium]
MKNDIKDLIPREGFVKLTYTRVETLRPEDRAALIRKGNALLNTGDLETAKRIFLTTGYSDGLIRAADKYLAAHEPIEALRLYKIAPAQDKAAALIEKMAAVVKMWFYT